MRTFAIKTIGCKVNQYEGQQIRQLLEAFGLAEVDNIPQCDLFVVNSCCLTQIASAKSRQLIHKVQRENPDAAIIVCGCLPIISNGQSRCSDKNVHFITNRNNLVPTLAQILQNAPLLGVPSGTSQDRLHLQTKIGSNEHIRPEKGQKIKEQLTNLPQLTNLTSFKGQTRAFLKVQDGCDGCCSYCVIPTVRPQIINKAPEEVLAEAKALVAEGHKEIVITGIYLGAYGQETVLRKKWPGGTNPKLAELLSRLAKVENLKRIRLSSLEPLDVTEKLLDVFCENPNIMPHLHLSLQSGSDDILKKMCRQYRVADFLEKVELIKSRLDRPAITTDLIVGFPSETDSDFEETISLARQVGFAKMHVFSFSARPGTAAVNMKPMVEKRVIRERSLILRQLDAESGFQFRRQFVGEEDSILTELVRPGGSSDGQIVGRSRRYFFVHVEPPCPTCPPLRNQQVIKSNEILNVRILDNRKSFALATLID